MTVTRIYWQPKPELNSLVTELERMFDRASIPGYPKTSHLKSAIAKPQPRIEIIENTQTFRVRVELPGLERKNIQVSASDRTLKIVGHRHRDPLKGRPVLDELTDRSFERVVTLPQAIDNTQITADLANGILTLTVPKRLAQRPKRVKINLGDVDSSTLHPEKSSPKKLEIEKPQAELAPPTPTQIPSDLTEDVWVASAM